MEEESSALRNPPSFFPFRYPSSRFAVHLSHRQLGHAELRNRAAKRTRTCADRSQQVLHPRDIGRDRRKKFAR